MAETYWNLTNMVLYTIGSVRRLLIKLKPILTLE